MEMYFQVWRGCLELSHHSLLGLQNLEGKVLSTPSTPAARRSSCLTLRL